MANKTVIILICLMGAALCDDSSDSSDSSYSFDSSESKEFSTLSTYFQYKVKALNTVLYYILQALWDDLEYNVDVDISFLKRINIIMTKIKSFYGEVDETNSLMLGEILRIVPEYLETKINEAGLNFNEYTVTAPIGTSMTTDTTI